MGLGKLLLRAIKYDVTDTTTGLSQTFTIGGHNPMAPDWAHGPYHGGMTQPPAWRAAVLLSDLLGSVPWHAYRNTPDTGRAEQIVPTPPLLDQPSPPDDRMTTFSSAALDLLWHGNAVGLVATRNRNGWPTAILPLPADNVVVERVLPGSGLPFPVGSIAYGINAWQLPDTDPRYGHGQLWFPRHDIWHVKGPTRPGELRGMGVVECHINGALKLAGELTTQAAGIADHAVPSVVIEDSDPDLTPTDAEDIKDGFMRSQRTRRPVVVSKGTVVTPLAWNPKDSQLLEARRFSVHEAALIFGLPPSFLGIGMEGGSMTYSNIEQEGLNLVRYSLGGHLARFEQSLSALLPRGHFVKANLDSLLRADTLTRYQAHEIGLRAGFLTDDEVRGTEDRPPLTPAQRQQMKPPPAAAPRRPEDDQDPEKTAPPAPGKDDNRDR